MSDVLVLATAAATRAAPHVTVNTPSGDPFWVTAGVALASALLGAAVGGYASFRANEALEIRRREARAMIRRKAKVYTPIREELVSLQAALASGNHLGYRGILREVPQQQTMRPVPVLALWADMVEDGRAQTSASTTVRELLDRVERHVDAFNAVLEEKRVIIEERGDAVLGALGGSPAIQNWIDSDLEHLVRDQFDELSLLNSGLEGHPAFNHPSEFVEAWKRDEAGQSAIRAVREAEAALTDSVSAAIEELNAAMTRIANRYEHESPED